MRMTIAQITDALEAALLAAPCSDDEYITDMTWDSRDVRPGALYVALRGERVDGHDFVATAIQAGARAAIVMRDPGEAHVRAAMDAGAAVLLVGDSMDALARLAAVWRKSLRGRVVGITGSTGKTTTKNLVRDVLAAAGSIVATEANQNNEIGVPRTLLAAQADTDSVVVEMGMRGMGQIAELCQIASPDWGLVTNAGESHIELLGSRQNIAHAKAELFEGLPDGSGIAFVNAADDYAAEMCSHARLAERGVSIVLFCGAPDWPNAANLDAFPPGTPFVWAEDVDLDAEGRPTFTMRAAHFRTLGIADADGAARCRMELRGMHNVSNACSAAAVGLAAGLTLAECCDVLAAAQPERGRQQVARTADGITVVDDSYNANPDSMRASLGTFAALQVEGRRVAVLGDMLELGDFSRECHERVGSFAAQAGLDKLVCVGALSEAMADRAVRDGMDASAVTCCACAEDALPILDEYLRAGDAVLVKASHSIGLSRVVEGLVK